MYTIGFGFVGFFFKFGLSYVLFDELTVEMSLLQITSSKNMDLKKLLPNCWHLGGSQCESVE